MNCSLCITAPANARAGGEPVQAEHVATVTLSPFRAAEVHRLAVPGGWLYVTTSGTGIATAFVPDAAP